MLQRDFSIKKFHQVDPQTPTGTAESDEHPRRRSGALRYRMRAVLGRAADPRVPPGKARGSSRVYDPSYFRFRIDSTDFVIA